MNVQLLIICGILLSFFACKKESDAIFKTQYHGTTTDTLIISKIISNEILAKLPLDQYSDAHKVTSNQTVLANINLKNSDSGVLSIISPGSIKNIIVKENIIENKSGKADSLINYLWKSTNEMFSRYNRIIFSEDKPDSVMVLFDSLIIARAKRIADDSTFLTKDEFALLNYQNSARVYSFLMFYGRIIKALPPENEFFDFIKDIENNNPFIKTLPDNVLYKLEIEYLRKYDSIASLDDFIGYISQKIENKDLKDFLTAIYLKSVIESPSYWSRHVQLFNTQSISEALAKEMNNEYKHLVESASSSFYSSQAGMEAYNFTAENAKGEKLQLSDLKGSVVLIDAWATWCGPCLDHRPQILDLAKKYHNNPKVKIIMISVDSSIDRWKSFIEKTNSEKAGIELIIPDGMNTEFGDKYLIKSIPKYILIDQEGIIINSNISEPSLQMEKWIEQAAAFE